MFLFDRLLPGVRLESVQSGVQEGLLWRVHPGDVFLWFLYLLPFLLFCHFAVLMTGLCCPGCLLPPASSGPSDPVCTQLLDHSS